MCLQTAWADDYGLPESPLKGAVLVSGVYDLAPLRHSCLQTQIRLDDGIIQRNSPVFTVRPCATPIWITWGETETSEFVRQAHGLRDAWQAAGNRSECAPISGAHHFAAIHGFEDPSSALCRWVARAVGILPHAG